MIYGYARVSTQGQVEGNSFEDQTNLIVGRYANATMCYEAESGAEIRPVFSELLEKLEKGDVLVVTKLDRFCRKTKEGLEYIDYLLKKGVVLHILNMGIVEDTPMGRLIITNLLAFAEFERAMIAERTNAGKAIARQNPGWREGRKAVEIPDFEKFLEKQKRGEISVKECCNHLKISRSTWYNRVSEVS